MFMMNYLDNFHMFIIIIRGTCSSNDYFNFSIKKQILLISDLLHSEEGSRRGMLLYHFSVLYFHFFLHIYGHVFFKN